MEDKTLDVMDGNPIGFEPVFSNERFVGRKEQIKEIGYYISLSNKKKANYFNLLIIGPKGSGKSSILNFIQNTLPEKSMYLFINIHVMHSNVQKESLFFKEMLTTISLRLKEICENLLKPQESQPCELEKLKDELKAITDTTFEEDISQRYLSDLFEELLAIAKKLEKTSLVLSFDDCDIMAGNHLLIQSINMIFSDLKPNFAKLGIGYQFIFLGTTECIQKMCMFTNSLKKVTLPFFSRTEVEGCICSQLSKEEISLFNEDVYDEVHKLTCGCPRIVMVFTHFVYREFFENPCWKLNAKSMDFMFIMRNSNVLEQVLSQLDTQYIESNVRNIIGERIRDKLKERDTMIEKEIKTMIEVAGTNIC